MYMHNLNNLLQYFPEDTPEETKKAVISQRRSLVQDFINVWHGSENVQDFLSKHAAENIEFEDFLQR